ncbi:hypothetical protein FACS189492_0070 [Clostridia bacterium]|nr:hypothetical protein FACS189492_0070 [Clostridia bacterium]
MQTVKIERENINAQSSRFTKRIGSTLYHVNVFGGAAKSESFEDKILRMMKNDLTGGANFGKIALPQADWSPERGSL